MRTNNDLPVDPLGTIPLARDKTPAAPATAGAHIANHSKAVQTVADALTKPQQPEQNGRRVGSRVAAADEADIETAIDAYMQALLGCI